MRIMSLDPGTKRIGVAMSDELYMIAHGADTIHRTFLDRDLAAIKKVVQENGVSEIVVGLPINMNGTHGPKALEVMEFIGALQKIVDVPIKTWDERLTTVQAERVLLEADISRANRRRSIDKIAAQIILQSYLDSRKRGQENV